MIHDISTALDGLQPFLYSRDDEIEITGDFGTVTAGDETLTPTSGDYGTVTSDQDLDLIADMNQALDYFH
jgi:hypothetical protein